jgi:hypothetical protein
LIFYFSLISFNFLYFVYFNFLNIKYNTDGITEGLLSHQWNDQWNESLKKFQEVGKKLQDFVIDNYRWNDRQNNSLKKF